MMRTTVTLPVDRLCLREGGALLVEQALARAPGVLQVYVSPGTEMVYVRYDENRCTLAALQEAIARAGADVESGARPAP